MLIITTPLTLEEEVTIQQSWMDNEDKCTFIVLLKCDYEDRQDILRYGDNKGRDGPLSVLDFDFSFIFIQNRQR